MPYLNEAACQSAIARIDRLIVQQIEVKDSTLALLAELRLGFENLPTARIEMQMRMSDFLGAVAALRLIDLDEAQSAGLFLSARNLDPRESPTEAAQWKAWITFRSHPVDYMLAADDETQRKLWTMIDLRQKPMMKVTPAHQCDTEAAP